MLTRKQGEAIIIDGRIRVVVHKCGNGDRVVLGFDAAKDVKIIREEIYGKEVESHDP
jgi:carbon storage regulator CsrA